MNTLTMKRLALFTALLLTLIFSPSYASEQSTQKNIQDPSLVVWLNPETMLLDRKQRVKSWKNAAASPENLAIFTQYLPLMKPMAFVDPESRFTFARFQGAQRLEAYDVTGDEIADPKGATLFLVFFPRHANHIIDGVSWGDCSHNRFLTHLGGKGAITWINGSTKDDLLVSPTPDWFKKPHLLVFHRDGKKGSIRIDGREQVSGAMGYSLDLTVKTDFFIGGGHCNGEFFGDFGEVILYRSALSASRIDEISDYLDRKFKIKKSN